MFNVQRQLRAFLRNAAASDTDVLKSLYNFEHGALAVARGRTGQ